MNGQTGALGLLPHQQGDHLTPEDGPVTINVTVVAPFKRNTEFTGQINISQQRE